MKIMKLFGTSKINEKGNLSIGGVDTVELAKEFKTPLYVMDQELIESGNVLKCDMVIHTEEEAIKAFEKDLPEVHFRDDSTI